MPYEPKLPALLDRLAQLPSGCGKRRGGSAQTIDIQGTPRVGSTQSRELLTGDSLHPPSAAPPIEPLSSQKAVTPVTPVTAVTDDDLEASLARLRQRCLRVEFRVPNLEYSLWMVSGPVDAEALVAEGVPAARIWTVDEMAALVGTSGMTHEGAVNVARLRQVFNATIVDIRSARTSTDPSPVVSSEPERANLSKQVNEGS